MGMDEQDKDVVRSTAGHGDTFASIMERRMSRRAMLKGTVAASTAVVVGAALGTQTAAAQTLGALGFVAIAPAPTDRDDITLPDGFTSAVLLRWGDPLMANAPEFDIANQTAEAQAQQFGYNNDYVGFVPLPLGSNTSTRGLLAVNHEYTNPELMFPGYASETPQPTQQQVDIELAAHGMSVVEVACDEQGAWSYTRDSAYNRRLTAMTPMTISGPAAGHAWLTTTADATGKHILGTLNNCAGGESPWGTVVSAEENFHQYFANFASMPDDDPRKAVHDRYGIPEEASERQWETFYDRFDVTKEPNEPFRFGWAVEVDPYDPAMTPIKRTAIGRFRHEAQTFVVTPRGHVVVYSGDDSRFEYVYKFVTAGTFTPDNRQANMQLLDDGTLYVATFNDDGTGAWLPVVYGQGPLTAANGFASQADVLLKTRLAADALGATKMDRPEDIQTNPVNHKVYMVMTNNTNRAKDDNPPTDAANPRPENAYGHIIEVTEANNDHAATTFTWDMFLLCGDPDDPSTYFAGFPKDRVSPIANPDNITFDQAGNLWITTDGQPRSLNYNDGYFAVPVVGDGRGHVQQFFAAVIGSEVTGPAFTPDNRTLFLAVQHPGEGGTFEEPISTWPDRNGFPRPSVLTIRAVDGTPVGQVPDEGVEATLPDTGLPAVLPGAWLGAAGVVAAATGAIIRRRMALQTNNEERRDK